MGGRSEEEHRASECRIGRDAQLSHGGLTPRRPSAPQTRLLASWPATTCGMGKSKDKNRAVISFDDAKRKDFLTGFRKRKKERKDYAQRKEQEELKKQQRETERQAERSTARGSRVVDLAKVIFSWNPVNQMSDINFTPLSLAFCMPRTSRG